MDLNGLGGKVTNKKHLGHATDTIQGVDNK